MIALAGGCGSSYVLDPDRDAGVADGAGEDAPDLGRPEICNGADDDLDGRTDEGCPIRLTRDPGNDTYPSLDGHRVAWIRIAHPLYELAGDLYVLDLPDGEERLVASGAIAPSLSGDRVAYLGEDALMVVDLVSGEETTVVPEGADFVQRPKLDGDLLVWSQRMSDTEEDYEVFAHDLATGRTTRLTHERAIQEFPWVEDGQVVFRDDRRGHHTVGLLHLYDVFAASADGSGSPRAVTDREGDWVIGSIADLDRGRVLVTEAHGPLDETFAPHPCLPVMYDVESGRRTELAPEALDCMVGAALSGSRVVLEHDPAGVSDLFLLDRRTGELRQVTDYPRRSTRPEIDGDILVWQDDRNDNWDLYMMDLTDVDRGDFLPEGVRP